MKSNTLTIIKKEFARFFGDRQMLFTTVIMPGLLIYIIYSIMGMAMKKMATEGTNELVTLCVENLPASVAPLIDAIPATAVSQQAVSQEDIDRLEDKNLNVVLMRFPEAFDEKVAKYDPQSGIAAPNVEIYYNSANNASSRVYHILETSLTAYEDQLSNRFDINRADSEGAAFDKASSDEMLGSILSKLIPMLILMLLFSGVMAIAPSAIAGEKERGTIATLLVTPLRRNELALGKVVSLSCIALLSGISSFIGIVLSLPKMIPTDAAGVELGLNFTGADYVVLLLIIFAYAIHVGGDVLWLDAYVPERRARKLDGLSDSLLQFHPGDDLGFCPRDEMDTCHRYLGCQCGLHRHRRLGSDPHVQQRKGDVLEIIVRVKVLYAKKEEPVDSSFYCFCAIGTYSAKSSSIR